jgi:hypothetical protein
MSVLVAIRDPALRREVVEGLTRTGFGVVEAGGRGPVSAVPDDALPAPGALHAAVVGHGLGLDALALGSRVRERHPCIGVVYLVGDPRMSGRARALDHRWERIVLRPLPGQCLCMALLIRVLGQAAGPADGPLSLRGAQRRADF